MTRCAAPGKRHQTEAGHLCDQHLGTLRGWLADVRAEVSDVDPHRSVGITYQPGHGGGAPAFEQVPVRLDAVVATDRRLGLGLHETPGDRAVAASAPSPLPVLHRWANIVRQARELTPEPHPTLGTEHAVLDRHLVWCASRPWIGDLYRAVRDLRAGLQRVNNSQDPKPLGRCPWLVDGQECRGPLWPHQANTKHTSGEFTAVDPVLGGGPVRQVVCGDDPSHKWAGRSLARLSLIVAGQKKAGGSPKENPQ